MTNGFANSLWLFTQSVEFLILAFPVTLVLIAHLIAAYSLSRSESKFESDYLMWAPFLWPFAILSIGGFFSHSGSVLDAPPLPIWAAAICFLATSVHSLVILVKRPTNRWVAGAVGLLAIWYGVCCWFVAGMALTND